MQDLEVFKQIPGYKAILKAVLKNQIQTLVHQLATETGEESVLITASLEEGTLSQLGSEFGKTFLEGHDEIKSQFLGFCLKRKQIQKQTKEFQETKPRKSWSSRRPQVDIPNLSRRSQPYPVSMTTAISKSANQGVARTDLRRRKQNKRIKTETTLSSSLNDNPTLIDSIPTNLQVTSFPAQGQSSITNCHYPLQVLPESSMNTEQVYVNSMTLTKDSAVSEYPEESYNLLKNNENHNADSNIKDEVHWETDNSDNAPDEMTDMTDEIVAGQIDDDEQSEHNGLEIGSADEEATSDGQDGSSQGQILQGQSQILQGQGQFEKEQFLTEAGTEISNGTTQERNEMSSGGKTEKRKPKLELFNQDNISTKPKSLKERKAELENYLNLENTDRPYPCNLCPKRFKERHHLVYHLRTHSGHRPYVCTICNKGFTQSSSLNTHRKLHAKDMSCGYCGQVFRKVSLLQNHVCKALGDDSI